MAKNEQIEIVEHIFAQEMSEALDTRFTTYAFMSLEDRALPDARDGLKPSQRRVLVAMNDLGLNPRASTEKCAKICGDTSGNYHPHGEAVVYPTMYRMAQSWVLRDPLVLGQGNFGNVDGDPPAAMRYTEAKLSHVGEALLEDLSPDVVPYVLNYNEKRTEPTVLPAMFPNLLVNGCSGIAVGWATNMPPHNLCEVVEVVKAYIANPEITPEEIVKIMPGPDFSSGGRILGNDGVLEYYKTGRGSIKMEGDYKIEQDSKGKMSIVVTALPYMVGPEDFIVEIARLVESGEITGIADVPANLSSEEKGTHVIIEIARNGNANLILNNLLKKTPLRTTFSVNQTVLINGKFVPDAGVLILVKAFVLHRKEVLTKKYNAELKRQQERIHILEGMIRVAGNIDETIRIIRASEGPAEASKALIAAHIIDTEAQAKAVLAITLSQLTRMEATKLQNEMKEREERVVWLNKTLSGTKEILDLVSKEQDDLAKKMGTPRRTKIQRRATELNNEDLIKDEQLVVSLTGEGYIKSTPSEAFKVQNRGGKGVIGKDEDTNIFEMFESGSKEQVLFFTNKGLMHKKKAYEIPSGTRLGKGTHVSNVLNLGENEHVTNMISLKSLTQKGFLLIATEHGVIKRTPIEEYDSVRQSSGLVAIKLSDDDQVAFALFTDGKKDVIIITKNGNCVRYPETLIPEQGRATQGSRGIKLLEKDTIAQVFALDKDAKPNILVVTSSGVGKQSSADEYRAMMGRNVKGYAVMKKSSIDKHGGIAGACAIEEGDNVLIMTNQGKVIRISSGDIKETGRATTGVRVVRLADGDTVTKIARLKPEEEIVEA